MTAEENRKTFAKQLLQSDVTYKRVHIDKLQVICFNILLIFRYIVVSFFKEIKCYSGRNNFLFLKSSIII